MWVLQYYHLVISGPTSSAREHTCGLGLLHLDESTQSQEPELLGSSMNSNRFSTSGVSLYFARKAGRLIRSDEHHLLFRG